MDPTILRRFEIEFLSKSNTVVKRSVIWVEFPSRSPVLEKEIENVVRQALGLKLGDGSSSQIRIGGGAVVDHKTASALMAEQGYIQCASFTVWLDQVRDVL